MFSIHAKKRMQQRAISREIAELVMQWGEWSHQRGADIYLGTKRTVKRLVKEEGVPPQLAERIRGVYLVVCDNQVVTVAHKH